MMTTTSIAFPYVVDAGGYQPNIEPAVTRVQFGGGYTQTSARGMNLDAAKATLTFSMRTKTEIDAILWTLKQAIGNRITFALPGETTDRLWDVQSWTPAVPSLGGQVWGVTVVVQETFEDGHENWNPLHMDMSTVADWAWYGKIDTIVATCSSVTGTTITVTNPVSLTSNGALQFLKKAIPSSGSWTITSALTYPLETGADALGWYTSAFGYLGVRNSRTLETAVTGIGEYRVDAYGEETNDFRDDPVSAYTFTTSASTTVEITIVINADDGTITFTNSQIAAPYVITFAAMGGQPDELVLGWIWYDGNPGYGPTGISKPHDFTCPYIYLDPL